MKKIEMCSDLIALSEHTSESQKSQLISDFNEVFLNGPKKDISRIRIKKIIAGLEPEIREKIEQLLS